MDCIGDGNGAGKSVIAGRQRPHYPGFDFLSCNLCSSGNQFRK